MQSDPQHTLCTDLLMLLIAMLVLICNSLSIIEAVSMLALASVDMS